MEEDLPSQLSRHQAVAARMGAADKLADLTKENLEDLVALQKAELEDPDTGFSPPEEVRRSSRSNSPPCEGGGGGGGRISTGGGNQVVQVETDLQMTLQDQRFYAGGGTGQVQ